MATIAQFRDAFPAFADSAKFTDPTVQFWLDVAAQQHNAERWGGMLDAGIMLYAAHHVAGDYQAGREAARGGTPGQRQGMVTSESGDSVSVSFDVSGTTEQDAGHWNSTIYGRRWYRLSRLFGAGPVQVGVGSGGDAALSAWAGPPSGLYGPW